MLNEVQFFVDSSAGFKPGVNMKSVARTKVKQPSSGWAIGREYLDGGVAIAEAQVGEGKVMLMGPEVAFRGERLLLR